MSTDPVVKGNVLSHLDMSLSLSKGEYREQLARLQARLNQLFRIVRERGRSLILVFEGWDAGGKGGAIRRVTAALDARDYRVVSISAPTQEENAYHYMWRFWRHLPRAGRATIFDRSWYGRVLVERIEGFAAEDEWRRAFDEINDFEDQLIEHGIILVKFWLHITPEEQEARFSARESTPHKRWKLSEEDLRNRDRWSEYEKAVDEMQQRTSTPRSPWHLVEGNDKRYARVEVLRRTCDQLEQALQPPGLSAPGPD